MMIAFLLPKLLRLSLAILLCATLSSTLSAQNIYTVSNTSDDANVSGSLRRAVTQANLTPSATAGAPHRIVFAAALNGGTITIGSELLITNHLKIEGPAAGVTITGDANNAIRNYRIVNINSSSVTVAFENVTITNGRLTSAGNGAGLRNLGTLLMTNCTVSNCTIAASTNVATGAGIGSAGSLASLALNRCTITGNKIISGAANSFGAGIHLNGGSAIINKSNISNNESAVANERGGGIYASTNSTLTMTGCTLSGNKQSGTTNGRGGAIWQEGTGIATTLTNCTLAGNETFGHAGAIGINGGSVTLNNCTVTLNKAGTGGVTGNQRGGGILINNSNGASLTVNNTIIAGNTSLGNTGPDIFNNGVATGSTFQNNIIGSTLNFTTGASWMAANNQTSVAAAQLFGSNTLTNNGGPTQTVALVSGTNPAVDRANVSGATTTDQRGLGITGSSRDLGAFERGSVIYMEAEGPAVDYAIGCSAVGLTSSLSLTTAFPTNAANPTHLTGASVQITTSYSNGSDLLSATSLPAGISSSWNAATGTLQLSGSAVPADYETALRNVQFSSGGGVGNRTIVFTATDGVASSSRTKTVSVQTTSAPILADLEVTTLAYSFNSAPVVITNTVNTSLNCGNLQSATISITNGYVPGADVLSLSAPPSGIAANWDAATGILSLSGTASAAVYTTAFHNVRFASSNTMSLGTREVQFTVNDGFNSSNTQSRIINVTSPPIITLANIETEAAGFANGTAGTNLTATLTASSPTTTFASATVNIATGYVNGQDELFSTSLPAGLSGVFASATGVYTITGSASLATYQTALRSIQFRNNAVAPTAGTRLVSFVLSDGFVNSNAANRSLNVYNVAASTTYHFSSSGGDDYTGDGSAAKPYQSLTLLNALVPRLAPGDKVYFKRGDTFIGMVNITGKSGAQGNPITLGAYGSGDKPLFLGTKKLTGWTLHSGNTWKLSLPDVAPARLFFNGQTMIPARYPNKTDNTYGGDGFIIPSAVGGAVSTSNGPATFTFPSTNPLTTGNRPVGYWTGASIRYRIRNWSYASVAAASQTANSITSTGSFGYAPSSNDYGFYMLANSNNPAHVQEVDNPGEFFYDATNKTLYAVFPGNASPATNEVEYAGYDFGMNINSGSTDIVVEDLDFHRYNRVPVRALTACHRTVFNRLGVKQGSVHGILILSSNDCAVMNSTVSDGENNGITTNGSNNTLIEGNAIRNQSLLHEYTIGSAIRFENPTAADNVTIRKNVIEDCGYFGIGALYTGGNLIEKNILRRCFKVAVDGGAIQLVAAYDINSNTPITASPLRDNIIRNNFSYEMYGYLTGGSPATVCGNFELSDYALNNQFYENTGFLASDNGLKTLGANGNVMRDNILIGASSAGLRMAEPFNIREGVSGNNEVKNNLFITLSDKGWRYPLSNSAHAFSNYSTYNYGLVDNNVYFNPYGGTQFSVQTSGSQKDYFLSAWKISPANTAKPTNSNSPVASPTWDASSTGAFYGDNLYRVTAISGANKITNGNFQTDVFGWTPVSGEANLSHTASGISEGAMQVNYNSGNGRVQSQTVDVAAGQSYLLSLSLKGAAYGKVRVQLVNGTTVIGLDKFFEVTPERTDEYVVFQATATTSTAMVQLLNTGLENDGQYLIDNIALLPVTAAYKAPTEKIKLLDNPSDNPLTIPASGHVDIYGHPLCTDLTVAPWTSKVVIRDDADELPIHTATASSVAYRNTKAVCGWYQLNTGLPSRIVSLSTQSNDLGRVGANVYSGNGVRDYDIYKVMGRNYVLSSLNTPSGKLGLRIFFTQEEFTALQQEAGATQLADVNSLGLIQYDGANQDNNPSNNTGPYQIIPPCQISISPYSQGSVQGYQVEFETNKLGEFWIAGPMSSVVLPPAVTNATVDANSVVDLTTLATTPAPNQLRWYATETGGIGSASAPSVATTALGEQAFWVSAVSNIGCESARQKVLVTVKDLTAPVVITQNKTIQLNNASVATITPNDINDGSSDAFGIRSMVLDKTDFSCENTGSNTVTLTVTDNNGNSASKTAIVTVEDNVNPTVLTKNISIGLSAGLATITPQMVDDGSFDACGIQLMSLDKTTFNCSQIGTHTVTLTVTDKNHNVASKTAMVTVIGQVPAPTIVVSRTNNTYTGPATEKTIVLGYGAQSLVLSISNPTATTEAAWSPAINLSSATGNSVVFTPTSAGMYTIQLTESNIYGCTGTTSVAIRVIDARCGNSKVLICHKPDNNALHEKTLCLSTDAVAAHLQKGCYLGSCGDQALTTIAGREQAATDETASLTVRVAPNPSATVFRVVAEGGKTNTPVKFRISDAQGRVVEIISGRMSGQVVQIGEQYMTGVYWVEVMQGTERTAIKLIKFGR